MAKNCKSLQLSSLEAIATGPLSFDKLNEAVRAAAAPERETPNPQPIESSWEAGTDAAT